MPKLLSARSSWRGTKRAAPSRRRRRIAGATRSNGSALTKGVEAESTILIGHGVAVYLNATKGSATYDDTGLWAQNAPKDTETLGVTYNRGNWNLGFFNKRVGQMYNDNGAVHQAFVIDPFNISNLFFNYTLRGSSRLSQVECDLA